MSNCLHNENQLFQQYLLSYDSCPHFFIPLNTLCVKLYGRLRLISGISFVLLVLLSILDLELSVV